MSRKENPREELKQLAIAGAVLASMILFGELYYTNYLLISTLDLGISFLDEHVFAVDRSMILNKGITIRSIIIFLASLIILFPSNFEIKRSFLQDLLRVGICVLVFYLSLIFKLFPYPNYIGQVLNILVSVTCFAIMLHKLFILSNHFSKAVSLKENNSLSDGFVQMEKLINTDTSINLTYKYSYKNEIRNGTINVINPFRASFVIGTPGSGKTYAVLEEYMRQLIQKGFSAVIYDYKDPALSKLTYNYYMQNHNGDNEKWDFWYISFQHINKTHRCNPIKNICSAAEALDVANVMLVALNKNFASKQGEFFVESAGKFTALNIYALGVLFQGRYQSLPHVVSLLCRKASVGFPALKVLSIFYPDMKNLFAPFEEAYDNNVVQQLQGQLASAQIGLGSMSDAALAFIMTEDDEDESANITLDINSFTNPRILCIGNDPEKDKILGLANSVYLSRLSKVLNKKGTPCLFAIDELPTVFINGLDNLIATARSNKIAVLLGFQDYSQLIRDYGDKIANAIINTIGNSFIGAVKGETAKRVSDSFGEKKIIKHSKSINEEGQVTTSTAEHKEKKIAIDIIEELSQGEFVGRVADEVETPIPNKVFYGKIEIDSKIKQTPLEIPQIRSWSEEEIKRNLQYNLINIDNQVSELLAALNSISKEYEGLKAMIVVSNENQGIALERFIENPSEETLFFLCVWLEKAYLMIDQLGTLDLKDDVLSFEMKFELLLRDVYNADFEGVKTVLRSIQEYNLTTIEAVQRNVEIYADTMKEVEQNYEGFQ